MVLCRTDTKLTEKVKRSRQVFSEYFSVHWLKPVQDLELGHPSSTSAPKKTGAIFILSAPYVRNRSDAPHD